MLLIFGMSAEDDRGHAAAADGAEPPRFWKKKSKLISAFQLLSNAITLYIYACFELFKEQISQQEFIDRS